MAPPDVLMVSLEPLFFQLVLLQSQELIANRWAQESTPPASLVEELPAQTRKLALLD